MEENTKQEETSRWSIFSEMIRASDPAKGITAMDYLNVLDLNVKEHLRAAYVELCESISELPTAEMERADSFLAIQKGALMLWEQLDKKVLEDYQAHRAAREPKTS